MPKPQLELLAGQQQKGETDKAVQACNDWLRLGAGRTMPGLLSKYREIPRNTATNSLQTLQAWSKRFEWAERARAYDASWEQRKNAEREAVFQQGLALDYERVRKLIRLAEDLEAQIYEIDEEGDRANLWVKDVKGIGSKADFERVEIERFNPALIEQFRQTLDDIAKETGGRVQKHEQKIDDWRSQLIAEIKAGTITYPVVEAAFDKDLATELFQLAGVPVESA